MPRASVILPWDRPFLPQLVDLLLSEQTRAPFNLSSLLIVVPTQQAGRRLRQALAVTAAERGSGVLAPKIVTPEQLLSHESSNAAVASTLDGVAAWTVLLQDLDLNHYRAIFPSDPPRQDANWAAGLAQQLASLQTQFGEHALDFSEVAQRVRDTERESERWSALSELEQAWKDVLEGQKLVPPNAAKRAALTDLPAPSEVTRIVLAGVIDPLPFSLQLLQRWSESVSIQVISHGDPAQEIFDVWGRVRPESVVGRPLPLGERGVLHVVRDTRESATLTATLAGEYRAMPQTFAVGVLDRPSLKALELAFHSRGLGARDLSGVSLGAVGLGLLAVQLLDLVHDTRPVSLTQIFRHPAFASFATESQSWAANQAELLAGLDRMMNDHLPSDLATLVAFAVQDAGSAPSGKKGLTLASIDLAGAVTWLAEVGEALRSRSLSKTLRAALGEIIGSRTFNLAQDDDAARAEEVEELGEILDRFADVEARFPALKAEAAATVLKRAIQTARRFPTHSADGWDLQGWLELAYEDAPHLVLVGFNEGSVPETVRGDIFLPNSLRQFLGLRSNEDRFRRDQILLEAQLRSRGKNGRVDIIIPRMSDSGDPLQPSRLLFCCADDELVPRAKLLFAELPPPRGAPARRPAWRLQPLSAKLTTSFSPSKLKAYLACPYRYYLKHVLRMEAIEVGKRELSATTFGNFCHAALEQLGKDETMRDVLDVNKLSSYLAAALEQTTRHELGVVDSFALRVQLESGRARLQAAAAIEAEERSRGWRIEQCEQPWTLTFGDMVINGRIDRIDRNLNTGAYRLIDYKTSDRGKSPEQAHWLRYKPTELHVLPESIFDMQGEPWRWVDLQLPLYLLAMRANYGSDVAAGYFVLPKTKAETGIRLWTQLAPEHLAYAETCARAIGAAVAHGRFWPPAERGYEDDTDYLFPDGIEADVDQARMLELFTGGGPT
jgi:ATP-dependent helicase/nuclease subunit B